MRWYLLFPLAAQPVQTNEPVWLIHRPTHWLLMLHRLFVVAMYMCILQLVLRNMELGSLASTMIRLYPLGFFMAYWALVRSHSSALLLQLTSSWLWMLCEAILTIGLAYVVLAIGQPQKLLEFSDLLPYGPPAENMDSYSANRWLWAALWGLMAFQIMVSWAQTRFENIKSALPSIGVFAAALVTPSSFPIEATITLGALWFVGAAYLAWPHPAFASFRN